MTKINYKSDFDFILRLKDCADPKKTVPFPEGDFDARFWTSNKANAYTASYRDGVYTNCFRTEDGGMHFVFDDHRMGKGTLHWEPHFELPNDIYPDNMQDLYRKAALDIELVDGDGDCPTTAELEAMLPYIKGEPFTFEDFTPEQIAELQRPATEAASSVLKLEKNVETAEKKRIADEQSRQEAEQARIGAEETRESNESVRQENEQERKKAETDRQTAEEERAEEFADWESEIDSKADRSELSNVFAEELLTSDNFPDIDTYTREELKMDLFIDLWNNRCKYGDDEHAFGGYLPDEAPDVMHPFLLNKIWMTYEEAIQTWMLSHNQLGKGSNEALFGGYGGNYFESYSKCKTYFPIYCGMSYSAPSLIRAFKHNRIVETLVFVVGYGIVLGINAELKGAFDGCWNLREIMSEIRSPAEFDNFTFRECRALTEIRISQLRYNIWLSDSPLLSLASLQYMVTHAVNTSAITITVHPDVFAKLTDETNTEWHALLALAAEKNISFATT